MLSHAQGSPRLSSTDSPSDASMLPMRPLPTTIEGTSVAICASQLRRPRTVPAALPTPTTHAAAGDASSASTDAVETCGMFQRGHIQRT